LGVKKNWLQHIDYPKLKESISPGGTFDQALVGYLYSKQTADCSGNTLLLNRMLKHSQLIKLFIRLPLLHGSGA